jgi:hypothetical protein
MEKFEKDRFFINFLKMTYPCKATIPDIKVDMFVLDCYLKSSKVGLNQCGSSQDLLRKNFVRLIDKALHEYGKARKYMIKEIEECIHNASQKNERGGFVYAYIIANCLEDCIMSINRACNIFQVLKKSKHFELDRQKMLSFQHYEEAVCKIRIVFENMEKELRKEELNELNSAQLQISANHELIEITKYKLSLKDLLLALEYAYELAVVMASAECVLNKN